MVVVQRCQANGLSWFETGNIKNPVRSAGRMKKKLGFKVAAILRACRNVLKLSGGLKSLHAPRHCSDLIMRETFLKITLREFIGFSIAWSVLSPKIFSLIIHARTVPSEAYHRAGGH